jgi:hypothetical protein
MRTESVSTADVTAVQTGGCSGSCRAGSTRTLCRSGGDSGYSHGVLTRLVPGWLNSHPLSIRWGLWVLTWGTNTARAGLAQLAPSVDPVRRQCNAAKQCNAAYSNAAQRAAARAPVRVYHYDMDSQWTRSGLARLGAVYRTLRALHAVQCSAVQCEQADPRRNALRDDRRRVPPPKVPCAIRSCNQLTVNPTTRE